MRKLFFLICLLATSFSYAQQSENIIIITTDGFRWHEVFTGMDKIIADDKRFNQDDSAYLFKKYWADNMEQRRKNLLPFFWSTIALQGQLYGNRLLGNKVNVSNSYWFSYPGYSEIMCGFVDTAINKNEYRANPNTTVMEFFNQQKELKGKVSAFGAWDAFDRILNEERSGIPVVAAYDSCGGKYPTPNEKLINAMLRDSYKEVREECFDVFTQYGAMEHVKTRKPKVLYIAYGETDEWAHLKKYRSYLDAAHQVDAWIKEIWDFVQSDPQYKNKTTLFITTDHGRGNKIREKWTSHGEAVEDADQIWLAALGPNVPASGEMKTEAQVYQKQFAQTMAKLSGYNFKAEHPVTEEIKTGIQ